MGTNLEAALAYAARGWRVLPIFEPDGDGWCSCRHDAAYKDTECRHPAKHPRPKTGIKAASIDEDQIRRWWKAWPNASVAIATGAASGIWCLSASAEGLKNLQQIELNHGAMPKTPTIVSGGGSKLFLFAHLPTLKLKELAAGLSILTENSYVVAPPSLHMSNVPYRWEDPALSVTAPLAAIPQWIIEAEKMRLQTLLEEAHKPVEIITGPHADDFDDAVNLYIHHNMQRKAPWLPFPVTPTACPICSGTETFRSHPQMAARWICTSTDHPNNVGKRQGGWITGDILDIDAGHRGRTRKFHMEASGFWGNIHVMRARSEDNARKKEAITGEAGTVTILNPKMRADFVLTRSFASLYHIMNTQILSHPILGEDRKLEYDEFAHDHKIGRKLITDDDISDIMLKIEINHQDKDLKGLTFEAGLIERAVRRVARNHPYHPVRDYLDGLKWDGVERICDVPKDVLGAENTEINRAWFKRWMISAVARIRKPGCQADHMLVLYRAKGGEGKSSFFRVLFGDDWFSDDAIDVRNNQDTPASLQGVWCCEWSEMTALLRSKEIEPVHAFISKRKDRFRRAYGHFFEEAPRQMVFCGTTNKKEFLRSVGGRRRWWIITTGRVIDTEAIARMRDQLWAEADHLFQSGEQWHPTADEKVHATAVQDEHTETDEWDQLILPWLEEHEESQWIEEGGRRTQKVGLVPAKEEVTVADILEQCLKIPPGHWDRSHENRVGEILTRNKWAKRDNWSRPRIWIRQDESD